MLTVQLYAQTARSIMESLEANPEFRAKCKKKFNEIVFLIRDEFKHLVGFYQISQWASKVLNSEKCSLVTTNTALSVALFNSREILEETNSKNEFIDRMYENAESIISSDKIFTKLFINEFIRTESYLPAYCFKNNLLKNFLYGSCCVN